MASLQEVDVVGVGLNATDTLIQLTEFPARGSKVEYDFELLQPGGQIATAMVACQGWGLRTRYVGKLGDDDAASLHEREFQRTGVDAHLVRVAGAASPRSLILVDGNGERTVLCRRDERLVLQPGELERDWIRSARVLLIDGHDTAAAALAASWAHDMGVPVVADLDEVYPGIEALLPNVDYPIVSRGFPGALTGERDLGTALRVMFDRFGCKLTAATLGEDGVLAWDGQRFHYAPAYCVDVVDTTGAGDIFHAGFVFGLVRDWSLGKQLDFACAAAAQNCTAQGARGGVGPLQEIEELILTGQRHGIPKEIQALLARTK